MRDTYFGLFLLILCILETETGCLYGRPCFGIMCAIGKGATLTMLLLGVFLGIRFLRPISTCPLMSGPPASRPFMSRSIKCCTTPTKYLNAIPAEWCDHYPVGSKVMYRCDDDSYPGGFITTCKQDGSWQKPPFQCRAIDCGKLRGSKLDATYIIDRNHGTKHRATVKILCKANNTISREAVCNNRGKWVYDLPPCPVSTRPTSTPPTTYFIPSTAVPEVVNRSKSVQLSTLDKPIKQNPMLRTDLETSNHTLLSKGSTLSKAHVYSDRSWSEVTTSTILRDTMGGPSENRDNSFLDYQDYDMQNLQGQENPPEIILSSSASHQMTNHTWVLMFVLSVCAILPHMARYIQY